MQSTFVHQDLLVRQLRVIFPEEDVKTETRKQSQLINPFTGTYLELDVWFPTLNIGFEFQDSYHYIDTWYSNDTLERIQRNDELPREEVLNNLDSTWLLYLVGGMVQLKGKIEEVINILKSTIYFQRPDLIPSSLLSVDPISFNPPKQFFFSNELPGIGELMLASFPASEEFTNLIVSGEWWMGEKYDGVRFCYNPIESAMYPTFTRTGNRVNILPPLTQLLPNVFMDAEFWFGRGNFVYTHTLCKGSVESVSWDLLRMVTFDEASSGKNDLPFEKRYHSLIDSLPLDHPVLLIAPRMTCKGSKHLKFMKDKVIENHGEGIIIRRVGSFYEHGRSLSLMKFKATHSDMEALVLDASDSVILKLPNNKVITVLPEQIQTREIITEGSIVTIAWDSHSRSQLSNVHITRCRPDLSWLDVLVSHFSEFHNDEISQEEELKREERAKETMRKFMEELARQYKLDPLIASSWRSIPFSSISHSKTGRLILRKYGGYFNALNQLFPEVVELDKSMLQLQNRRIFFEDYAKQNGFDPYSPDQWYLQRPDQIMSHKAAKRVMFYHNYNVSKALKDLFPDIGLDDRKLNNWSWQYMSNRRKFFEEFAAKYEFDPLHTERWYSQNLSDIMKFEGVTNVLWYHNNSVTQALLDLFPNLGFDRSKLLFKFDKDYINQLRHFFESYAEGRGFDPLNAKNWYLNSKKHIMSTKGSGILSGRYKNVLDALKDAFPEIGIEISSPLDNAANRRLFFENYAKSNGFDPLVSKFWYLQSREKILAIKGAHVVLSHYNNKISLALVDLFPEVAFSRSTLEHIYEWKYKENRRRFFDRYAKENLFDPLVSDNWYTKLAPLQSAKGITAVVSYHKYNIILALLDLFPDGGLNISRFIVADAWSSKENRRKFFERYANDNHFDPLVAENWYSQSQQRIMASKGALQVMLHHNNSISTALVDLFSNIGLTKSLFWNSVVYTKENAKRFFLDYAQANGFDPHVAENWYSQTRQQILATKGAAKAISLFNGSVSGALVSLFSDIGLVKSKLWRYGWNQEMNRKRFFEGYASANSFDPLVPKNWYRQNGVSLLLLKNATEVLQYHKSNICQALLDLFPDISLDSSKMLHLHDPWNDERARRVFFENYANTHGFNPLNPEDWYSHPLEKIIYAKNAAKILSYHNGKVANALISLFQDINLDKTKFCTRVSWTNSKSRMV